MTDNLTPEQRSYAMSRIRSRGNSSTEEAMIRAMRKAGLSGWRRSSTLCGKPDFIFRRFHVAIFVDGCYWHGCRKCALASKSNREYWEPKISGNMKRDRANTRRLRESGWTVVRIWEHDLKSDPIKGIRKIMKALRSATESA